MDVDESGCFLDHHQIRRWQKRSQCAKVVKNKQLMTILFAAETLVKLLEKQPAQDA